MSKQTELKDTESNGLKLISGLTHRQIQAIPHLLGAGSLEEGRRKARICKSTLYQWLKDETFRAELNRKRGEVIKDAIERLKTSVTRAVDGLLELAQDEDKSIKLRACEKVLDFFLKVKEIDELEGRLEKIERIILEKRSYR